jgi:hypothetical protein
MIVCRRTGAGTLGSSDRGGTVEAEPQQEDTKAGDPPKEDWEGGEKPEPSEPPPESIPGDSGEVPNPSQN